MKEGPRLTESAFHERVTELAKQAIREHCVDDDGSVEYVSYAAQNIVSPMNDTVDLIADYPLSVEEFASGEFRTDDAEFLGAATPQEAITRARVRALECEVDERIQELLDGEWDAITTTTDTRTVTETKTVFDE